MRGISPYLWLAALTSSALCADPTISQPLYDEFVKYTLYAAASYASSCPLPPNNSTVVAYLSNSTTDTQATLFRNDADAELVLAFRGTSDLQDFLTDANQALVPYDAVGVDCDSCLVNNGTLIAFNSLTPQILSVLSSQHSLYPTYNLVITGHSLGGALASLASAPLLNSGWPNLTTYTLGQFRTGDPSYAAYVDELLADKGRMYRITHTDDGVPQTISRDMGYLHQGVEFWELEPFGADETEQCQGDEDPTCNDSTDGVGIGDGGRGINAAHLCYTGILIGNPVDAGASACNAVSVLPRNCSTATGGGIVRKRSRNEG